MRFTVVIMTHLQDQQAAASALKFCQAVLRKKHVLESVFFYGNGVYMTSNTSVTPQDEFDINAAWKSFIEDNNIKASTCIAAGLRRGIIDSMEAKRYGKNAVTLEPPFQAAGLGQLIEACAQSDRVLTFG